MEGDATYPAPKIAQSRPLDDKIGSLQESSAAMGFFNNAQ